MDFTFNSSAAMIYDFLRIIIQKFNGIDSNSIIENLGVERDQSISNIKGMIWDESFKSTPGLSLLFSKGSGQNAFISHIYDSRIPIFSSIDELINDFSSISDKDLLFSILKFYSFNDDTAFLNSLLNDETAFYNHILSLENLSDKQRLELMTFYGNPLLLKTPIIKLMRWTETQIQKVYIDNNDRIRTFERKMKSKIKVSPDEIVDTLTHLSNGSIPNSETNEITLSYSFLNEILVCSIGKTNPTVLLGINYEKYLKAIEHDDSSISNENFLKAFSDNNRLEIIRMLNGKEMFVGEITKNCGLSFSTTSYHIDILINAGILHRHISNRRVYYKLNVGYLTRRLDQIKGSIISKTF